MPAPSQGRPGARFLPGGASAPKPGRALRAAVWAPPVRLSGRAAARLPEQPGGVEGTARDSGADAEAQKRRPVFGEPGRLPKGGGGMKAESLPGFSPSLCKFCFSIF